MKIRKSKIENKVILICKNSFQKQSKLQKDLLKKDIKKIFHMKLKLVILKI